MLRARRATAGAARAFERRAAEISAGGARSGSDGDRGPGALAKMAEGSRDPAKEHAMLSKAPPPAALGANPRVTAAGASRTHCDTAAGEWQLAAHSPRARGQNMATP